MKYRDHRGSLTEAMKTVQEFDSMDALKRHINAQFNPYDWDVEDVKFESTGFDRRIGWDSHYVLANFRHDRKYIVVGMSDGKL